MTRSLGTLSLDLVAKTGGFEAGMDKAARVADKKTREIERIAQARAKSIETAFTDMASSIAGPLAAVFSVGAFTGMVRGVADAGDQLQKLSVKTGAAVEELSKLQYAASLSDLSNEDLGTSLIKLNRVMGDAANGSKEATEALARFGIAPKSGLSAIDAFKQIADRVKATGDEAQIASGLNDVLGKSFANLLPLLKGGSDGLKDAGDELERMGGVMSGDLATSSEAFNDNITRLSTKLTALKLEVIGPIIPLFLEISNAMATTSENSDKLSTSGQGLKTVFESVAVLGVNVAYVFNAIGTEIGGIAAQAKALSTGDFKAFSNIGQMMREDAEKARKEVDALSDRLLNPTAPAASTGASAGTAATITGTPGTPAKSKVKTTKADAYTDPLTEAAKLYASVLSSLDDAQLKTNASGLTLTATEAELMKVMNNPRFAQMPEEWQAVIKAQADYVIQAEQSAEAQKRLNDLLDATPTAQLEHQRDTMLFLSDAFKAGKISAEQFSEATSTALGNIPAQAEPAIDSFLDMTTVANDAARAMADGFTDYLFDPVNSSIENMLLGFLKATAKMIAQAAMLSAVKAGMSALGIPGFAKGGVFDGNVQAFASGGVVNSPTPFKFASGGSFKSGVMGEAGPEAIMPLKRGADGKLGVTLNGGGSSGGVNISIVVNEGEGETKSSDGKADAWNQFAQRIKGMILDEMTTQKRPGGLLYA